MNWISLKKENVHNLEGGPKPLDVLGAESIVLHNFILLDNIKSADKWQNRTPKIDSHTICMQTSSHCSANNLIDCYFKWNRIWLGEWGVGREYSNTKIHSDWLGKMLWTNVPLARLSLERSIGVDVDGKSIFIHNECWRWCCRRQKLDRIWFINNLGMCGCICMGVYICVCTCVRMRTWVTFIVCIDNHRPWLNHGR